MLIEIHQTSILTLAVSSSLLWLITRDKEAAAAVGLPFNLFLIFLLVISAISTVVLTLYRIWA